jgi:hypothetical protein
VRDERPFYWDASVRQADSGRAELAICAFSARKAMNDRQSPVVVRPWLEELKPRVPTK